MLLPPTVNPPAVICGPPICTGDTPHSDLLTQNKPSPSHWTVSPESRGSISFSPQLTYGDAEHQILKHQLGTRGCAYWPRLGISREFSRMKALPRRPVRQSIFHTSCQSHLCTWLKSFRKSPLPSKLSRYPLSCVMRSWNPYLLLLSHLLLLGPLNVVLWCHSLNSRICFHSLRVCSDCSFCRNSVLLPPLRSTKLSLELLLPGGLSCPSAGESLPAVYPGWLPHQL